MEIPGQSTPAKSIKHRRSGGVALHSKERGTKKMAPGHMSGCLGCLGTHGCLDIVVICTFVTVNMYFRSHIYLPVMQSITTMSI